MLEIWASGFTVLVSYSFRTWPLRVRVLGQVAIRTLEPLHHLGSGSATVLLLRIDSIHLHPYISFCNPVSPLHPF